MNKLISFFLIVLVTVISFELGFYICSIKKTSLENFTSSSQYLESVIKKLNIQDKRQYLVWLDKKNKVLTSSVMIDESQGKIISINNDNASPSTTEITLSSPTGDYSFKINPSHLKIIERQNGQEKNLTLKDLKINDIILIKETFNLLPDTIETTAVQITKL